MSSTIIHASAKQVVFRFRTTVKLPFKKTMPFQASRCKKSSQTFPYLASDLMKSLFLLITTYICVYFFTRGVHKLLCTPQCTSLWTTTFIPDSYAVLTACMAGRAFPIVPSSLDEEMRCPEDHISTLNAVDEVIWRDLSAMCGITPHKRQVRVGA